MKHKEPDHESYSLFHCVPHHAWELIIGAIIIVFLYAWMTAFRFIPAMRAADGAEAKMVWLAITLIFPFCGGTGYLTTALSGWYPALSYPLRVVFQYFDIAACLIFLWFTRGKTLVAKSTAEFRRQVSETMYEYEHGGGRAELLSKMRKLLDS